MKKITEYLAEENIVLYLCRIRAKLAKQRNKKHLIHLLSNDKKTNYHKWQNEREDHKRLAEILPSRRKWKKNGERDRFKKRAPSNSIERNILSIKKAIKFDKANNPKASYLDSLKDFIADIEHNYFNPKYNIKAPDIYPKLKLGKKALSNICRPISEYQLMDKIIIGITNKYFTELFDRFFSDSSFAFRAPVVEIGKITHKTHHDAFKKIIEYREIHKGKELFVAECDMRKFYDTVNHIIINKYFRRLLKKANKHNPDSYSFKAKNIFYKYLDSYTFNENVLPLNKNQKYFEDKYIKDGSFEWVEKELIEAKYYRSIGNEKIGIPQGGALSGLIANIVLDYADRRVLKDNDEELLYVRFCDDIIIIHPDKGKCLKAYKTYRAALTKLKLIPHPHNQNVSYSSKFWVEKSKKPYKWGPIKESGIPWIGFVGYEINYRGDIRVRKSSLKKEMKKQYELVSDVKKAVLGGKNRVNSKAIEESVINRLIGMSVGRVKIWNYQTISNEMCWVNGFIMLNDNKYSRIQLKRLDRSRNRLIYKLRHELKNIDTVDAKGNKERGHQKVYYGKPFSYYYQMIEKKRLNDQKDYTKEKEAKNGKKDIK